MTGSMGAPSGPDPAVTAMTVGLFRVGPCMLAVSVDAVREVIRRPARTLAVPSAIAGLVGAVDVRGVIIPVLDLRAALGLGSDHVHDEVVVILRQYGRLVGLLADGVNGIATIDRHRLTPVEAHVPVGTTLHTHSFTWEAQPVWLLDAARIAAIPGLPMVAEAETRTTGRSFDRRVTRLFFRTGPFHFALQATEVDATVARAELRPSPLTSRLCHGVFDHHGRSIPAVDPLRLLGLGALEPAGESPILILRCRNDGRVGLRIDAVHDMVAQAADDVLPMPALAVADPSCFEGVTVDKHGTQHLVLSAEGLRDLESVDTYARLSGIGPLASGAAAAAQVARNQVVVFTAGARAAVPLLQLQEVIAYPEVVTAIADVRPHLIGLFDHRGKPIPLLALDRALGARAGSGAHSRVLLVSGEAGTVGFAVDVLHGIEAARAMQPHDRRAVGHVATAPSMNALVEIGAGGGEVLPLLDLQALMAELSGGAAVRLPRQPALAASA